MHPLIDLPRVGLSVGGESCDILKKTADAATVDQQRRLDPVLGTGATAAVGVPLHSPTPSRLRVARKTAGGG